MATVNTMPASLEKTRSVTGGKNIYYYLPYAAYNQPVTLPEYLPAYTWGHPYNRRDRTLLYTLKAEAQWATAVGTAISKMASMGWEIESEGRLKRKRWQQILLNASAGTFWGWTNFIQTGLKGFLCLGLQYIEIERDTPANGSKIRALHHLNPLQCQLTNNPRRPVRYYRGDGSTTDLWWHQVIVLADQPDPTCGMTSVVSSAAERAYTQITKLAAIEMFIYEKITGNRPASINFLQGAMPATIDDAIASAREESAQKGNKVYMGAWLVPMPTDTPLNIATVPLKDLPDGFDANEERLRADLIYANALGLDVQDVNPALIGNRQLGAGTQSVVLDEKSKGKGLSVWRQSFTHMLNQLVLDDKSLFTFQENDLRDEKTEAGVQADRQKVRTEMINAGMITSEEARNLAVDDGDLPNEFIQEDITAVGSLGDDEKNLETNEDKPKPEIVDTDDESEEETVKEFAVDEVWYEGWH